MLVSRKIGVIITKKYFFMFPYTYLIFHIGQFYILVKQIPAFFQKKFFGLSIPTIWKKEGFPSFPQKIIFAPQWTGTKSESLCYLIVITTGNANQCFSPIFDFFLNVPYSQDQEVSVVKDLEIQQQ